MSPIYLNEDRYGRYVFLNEGETYEYINRPPGEGLAKHIESVLGIDSMENLENTFGTLYKKYSDVARDLRKQVTGARLASEQDKISYTELNKQLNSYLEDQKSSSEEIEKLNKEHNALSSEVALLKKSQAQIVEIFDEWQRNFGPLINSNALTEAIKEKRKQLENKLSELTAMRDQLATQGGVLSVVIESTKSVIKLIRSLPDSDNERLCPVCRRPLSVQMAEEIEGKSQKTIHRLQEDLAKQKTQIKNTQGELEETRNKLNTLGALELEVNNILKYGAGTLSNVEIQEKIADLEGKATSLMQQVDQRKKNRDVAEPKVLEIRSMIDRISENIEPSKMGALNRSLMSATRVEFLSQIFLDSVKDSLTKQRGIMLSPLMKELSTMWSKFMNTSIEVELGEKCEFNIIDKRYHAPFKFPQLSGGEKTALLILTHILLCKRFSDGDFMLIDEPLEHLDSRNRWSLINFLIRSCARGTPEQLIITTIEEPFIREYMDNPLVRVTKLA